MPKVSVVIPVYNVERYLGECLDSILGQTLRDIEVICVDDGSTDDSPTILGNYAAQDPRLRVIRQENAGSGAARNRALDEAQGDSVMFMDPDDRYPSPDVLERMWAALESSGCEMAGGVMRRFPVDNPRAAKLNASYDEHGVYPHSGIVTLDEYQSPFRYTCYIYRRALLDCNGIRFPKWRRFQDPPFLARALIAAGRFWATEEAVYDYRVADKPVDWMSAGGTKLREFLGGFDELLDISERAGCRGMYVAGARAVFRGGRFKGLPAGDPMWDEVRRRMKRLRRSGWLTLDDWAAMLRMSRFDGILPKRIVKRARVVGLGVALGLEIRARAGT